jgi:hypothetical protein
LHHAVGVGGDAAQVRPRLQGRQLQEAVPGTATRKVVPKPAMGCGLI